MGGIGVLVDDVGADFGVLFDFGGGADDPAGVRFEEPLDAGTGDACGTGTRGGVGAFFEVESVSSGNGGISISDNGGASRAPASRR